MGLVAASCSEDAAAASVSIDPVRRAVRLEGTIRAGDAASLDEKLASSNFSDVIIWSPGGDGPEAMALFNVMRRHRVNVEVGYVCASACAQYILLPSPRARVSKYTMVIFHHSYSSLVEFVRGDSEAAVRELFADEARREREFYSQNKVPKSFLYEGFVQLEPICYSPVVRDGAIVNIVYRSKFDGWTPSAGVVKSLGVSPAKGWPQSEAEWRESLKRTHVALRLARFEYLRLFGRPANASDVPVGRRCDASDWASQPPQRP